MNKIYKVIWNNVKHCYVVVSELAKCQGKGCRVSDLHLTVLSLSVTVALMGCLCYNGAVVHAAVIELPSNSNITVSDNQSDNRYYINGSNIKFTINSQGIIDEIYGSSYDSIGNNTISINGGVVQNNVNGGGDSNGDNNVMNNSVKVTNNGKVFHEIRGGSSGNGIVSGNNVTVENSTIGHFDSSSYSGSNGYVYGGYAESNGAVNGNHVVIDKGIIGYYDTMLTIDGNVYGGHSYDGEVANNIVEFKDGQVTNIRGGENYNPANTNAVHGNNVTIAGGTVHNNVHGGYAYGNSDLIENKVIVNSGTIKNEIHAGYAEGNGNVTYNSVEINGGNIDNGVVGGYVFGSGKVTYNSVHLTGGKALSVTGGYSYQNNTGLVENNTVIIDRGTVVNYIYAGATHGTVDVTKNSIVFNGGEAKGLVVAGWRNYYGENTGKIEQNTVTVNGGTLQGDIFGGASFGHGIVNHNNVEINGGIINGSVYGGRSNTGNITNNVVALKGVSVGGSVYGGFGYDGESDVVTGNTLILSKAENTVGGEVRNFETIRLADTVTWAEGKTVLTANQFTENADGSKATLDISEATDFSKATSGTMTMLASDIENNLSALTLKYAGGTAELNTDNQLQVIKAGTAKTDKNNGVIISYNTGEHIVFIDSASNYKKVNYSVADVAKAVSFSEMEWDKGHAATEYNYSGINSLDTTEFTVLKPETVAANTSMILLEANNSLKDMAEQVKNAPYSIEPVSGVAVEAILSGKISTKNGKVTYTASSNQASKLTFGDVEWKDSSALLDHKTMLANVSFDGAVVDTTQINFTNKEFIEGGQQMTLVSDYGGKPGSITGSKFKAGTAYEGEGFASMEGDNLIFKTKSTGVSDETHTTVMSMEAGVALLAAGNEHIGVVAEGLGNVANMGADGTATAASVGGGASRYETGSHVDTHNWNAAVAVGRKRELKNGELEYGIFGEYGKTSYSLHSDDGRGDGDSHYAGGGLLAKWTNKHDVYTEASFRMGRMSDNARNILHDGAGNAYGYNVHANYYGGHVGVGKVFKYNGGKSLDVYGKYFYNRRNGVNFTAGVDRYSLDAVASSVVRIGARYGTTNKKWNAYGGLAYEYEMDGKSAGTVNSAAIRAASIKGGSIRGEIGIRMDATKTNPWKADISIYGYGGKHRGFGGNVSVAYMF